MSGPEPTTPLDLEAIRKRVEATSPGPWTDGKWIRPPATGAYAVNYGVEDSQRQHDAAFIAHARTDVPALLADLDAAREALRQAEQQRDDAILTLNNVREHLELVGANFDRVDAANAELTRANTKFHAQAVMAEAERDRMRPVVEAARVWIRTPWLKLSESHPAPREAHALVAAVHAYEGEPDTYETQEGIDVA